MAVLHTEDASLRLGFPDSTCERGTIESGDLAYARFWSWTCGCRGEIIAGTLIDLNTCARHRRAA